MTPPAATVRRVAVVGADRALHAMLRDACELPLRAATSGDGLAYVGSEFRTYDFMRIGEAIAFYAALNAGRWSAQTLAADLATAGLLERFEIRRMKRAYRRALVLALAMATLPELLVVECGEEFDEPGAAALLDACVARAPRTVVTFGDADASTSLEATRFDARLDAAAFRALVASDGSLLRYGAIGANA